ncbi:MAG: type II secretion system protein [Patescibacteria group bacterium]|nr:type II secretion system protein [Patescibacteria group bacterium]
MGKLNKKNQPAGFTLIELLVVISIIGFLTTATVVMLNNSRMKARDAKRLADMKQVITALDLYFDNNNQFPTSDADGCASCSGCSYYDTGNKDYILLNNKLSGIMNKTPADPTATGNCAGYLYNRYAAGTNGCDSARGAFYVLGVVNMETSANPYAGSPGFSCPSYNWQTAMDWVTGKFEK